MYLRFYLQTHHNIARRTFTRLVDQGKIILNGKKVDAYAQEVKNNDMLQITGEKSIHETIQEQKSLVSQIVLFNKPVWYVASKSDTHNTTIYEILPKQLHTYYYIGRLDKDSHWLLLLTNNPSIVHEFEHPKKTIEKEYIVELDIPIKMDDIEKMMKWIKDKEDILKAKKVSKAWWKKIRIFLTEGKNRHIRRMCKALWYNVIDLQRIREGEYILGDLKKGAYKIIEIQCPIVSK